MSKWTYINVWQGEVDDVSGEEDDSGVDEARRGDFGSDYTILIDTPGFVVVEWKQAESLHIWVRHE